MFLWEVIKAAIQIKEEYAWIVEDSLLFFLWCSTLETRMSELD